MTRSILRAVVCGVIVGALAFFVPHLLLGILVFFFVVRLFHCCGHRRHGCCGHGYHHGHSERLFYLADRVRKMTDEEYTEFKQKMGGDCCGSDSDCCGSNCCGSKSKDSACCETKKEETSK